MPLLSTLRGLHVVCPGEIPAELGSPRSRRSLQHRFRRRRMPQEGMLIEIDASHHAWLEERGPKLVLLLAVDDATGVVAQALFHPSEDISKTLSARPCSAHRSVSQRRTVECMLFSLV